MRITSIITMVMLFTCGTSVYAVQRRATAKPAAPNKPSTSWEFSSSTDAMSDATSFSASKRGDVGLLSISCKKDQKDSFTVLVGSDSFLGSNRVGMRELTYRLDDQPPIEGRWAYSGRAAMLTNTDQSAILLIPMMKATRLLVRMYSYDGTSQDIIFDVSGAAETTKRLLASCQISQQ